MPIITPPSVTHNPGRIRHRMMPYSYWNNSENNADVSLYPGQIGVVVSEDGQTDVGPPTSQVYLRVGNNNSTSKTNGYGQAYKVVPEDETIITRMIADNAITTSKIADNAVTTGKIKDSAVTTGKIADNAITAGELGSVIVTGSTEIGKLKISLTQSGSKGGLSIGGVLTDDIEFTLSGNVTGSSSFAQDGGFTDLTISTTIADNAVTTSKIASSAVTTDKIANSAVTLSKLKRVDLLSQGATDPTSSNTGLFYLNTTNNTLHVNKGTSSPSWVAVVGVWG